ncbi:MAG: arsenosugar biosynthesis radical SAM (seleno)protein ArsS [Pseudomonadota bacterium]
MSSQMALLSGNCCGETFFSVIRESGISSLRADGIEILQMNITRQCNLSCRHCHVEAGPDRKERMDRKTLEHCLLAADTHPVGTIDITGGAPELHPDLPWFLEQAARAGRRVIVRSNLVILQDLKYAFYLDLFACLGIEVVGSVPDYRLDRAERQRGKSTFLQAIASIRELNQRGYGLPGSGLILSLAHNPSGAYLPAGQASLEHEYRFRLREAYGIEFNRLFCLTNCPVGRYLDYLVSSDNFDEYMCTLKNAFNPAAVRSVMCRTTLSVGWDGRLFDCDFNQMLDLPVNIGAPRHIRDFDFDKLASREIMILDHCFACTAGAGSSCQGELAPS